MAFHHWSTFIHMGGYAGYVWSAYGVVVLLAFAVAVVCRIRFRRIARMIKQCNA